MQLVTSFSIESIINPTTKKPFGTKYTGSFSIRRPNLKDKTAITLRYVAGLATAGGTGIHLVIDPLLDANYLFCQLEVIKEAPLPEWFAMDKIYEEDEPAIDAVRDEVQKFLDSFRVQNGSTTSSGTV